MVAPHIDLEAVPIHPFLFTYLNELQQEIYQWAVHNKFQDDPTWTFYGLVEEIGELSHAMLKQHQGIRGTFEEHEQKGKDAVGDFLVFLAHYCSEKGWSLSECLEIAWSEARERDFVKFPGNGVSE